MTITQHDLHEAEQQHREAVEKLDIQMNKLAGLDNELTQRRSLLNELQKSVERQRARVNELSSAVDLASHRCLEIKCELEKRETVQL